MTRRHAYSRRAVPKAAAWISMVAALVMVSASAIRAQSSVDLRQTFPHIPPYTTPPSPPVTADFAVPAPGVLHVRLVLAPYYRNMEPLQFRSKVPVDGADLGAFRPRVPGGEPIETKSTPERWVDGSGLELVSTVRFRKARPALQVGLFPSVVRYGDGSSEQLKNSVQVQIWFEPDGATSGAPSDAPAAATPWATVIETAGAQRWTAEWTLLADGVSFDATWRHEPDGDTGVNRGFARIVRIEGSTIVIDRPGLGQYTGTISADRRTITGTVSWTSATWRATLRAPLPTRPGSTSAPTTNPATGPVSQPAETIGLAGRWLDGQEVVTLRQDGDSVTGDYAFRDGRLNGTARGRRFTGVWRQSESATRCTTAREGTFFWGRFDLTVDGDRLEGRWGYCDRPMDASWSWRRSR